MKSRQSGMTLIELLLALVIGSLVMLAVDGMLVVGQTHKRVTTSKNDAELTGAYAFYELQRALRGAGSAIAQSASPDAGLLGCRLNATSNGVSFLPRTGAFPAPFSTNFLGGVPSALRVAPVLIGKNQSDKAGSDVIVLMGGSGAAGGVPRAIYNAGTSIPPTLQLESYAGFSPTTPTNDLVILSQSGTTDCLLEEVASITPPTMNLGGTGSYVTVGGTFATLAASTASQVTPIGNAAANNVQFELFGVGINDTLYSYDLLQNQLYVGKSGTDTSQAIADGVVRMNAIYGIESTTTPGTFGGWADPGTTSGYDINSVMASTKTMKSIIAVRVAIVVRGEYYDKVPVSPSSLTLFNGLVDINNASVQQTFTINLDNQHYRYRLFEFTVPLRNMLILCATC
jgi:type IV pilus assembly protein PilW